MNRYVVRKATNVWSSLYYLNRYKVLGKQICITYIARKEFELTRIEIHQQRCSH